jgi:hypothetical protein
MFFPLRGRWRSFWRTAFFPVVVLGFLPGIFITIFIIYHRRVKA